MPRAGAHFAERVTHLSERRSNDPEAGKGNRHQIEAGTQAHEQRVADDRQAGAEKNRNR
jgi:hypothetical protein